MTRQAPAVKDRSEDWATEPPGKAAVRLLAGFAGFGAASVNLAVSSSLFAAAGTGALWLTFLALAAGLWGAALLAWAVAALRSGNFPLPRTSAAALPAAAAVHVLTIAAGAGGDTAGLSISHLAALLLTLMIISAMSWLSRQPHGRANDGGAGDAGRPAPGRPGAGRLLGAAFAGALAVAAITTPGLAASTAGEFAVPHGSHSDGGPGHHGL